MRVILSAFALLLSAASQAMQAPEVEYGGYLSFETQEGVMQGPAAWARDRERREFIMDGASVVIESNGKSTAGHPTDTLTRR